MKICDDLMPSKPKLVFLCVIYLQDRYGRTALIWACDCAQLQCVQVLIRLSANINIADAHTGRQVGRLHSLYT
jgi:ankyrin repeat protein